MSSGADAIQARQLAGIAHLLAASRPGPWRAAWTDRVGPCPLLVITAADGVHLGDWEASEDARTSLADPMVQLMLQAPADLAWGCDLLQRAKGAEAHSLTPTQRQRLAQIAHRLHAARVDDWLLDYVHDDIPAGDVYFTWPDEFATIRWSPGDASVPSFAVDSCADPHVLLIAAGPRNLTWLVQTLLATYPHACALPGTSIRAALFGAPAPGGTRAA